MSERVLHFKQPAGTSRGVYTERKSWFVTISDGKAVGHIVAEATRETVGVAMLRARVVKRVFYDVERMVRGER